MSTIAVPDPLPTPAEDAQSIRKAVEGRGTDEKALIRILGGRTAAHRSEIRRAYAGLYKESLLERLHSELSGNFRKAMVLWTMEASERDANLANKALKNGGDKYIWVLIEIACASTPDHLISVRRSYRSLFFSSIEEDVASSSVLREPLRAFLVRLLSSYRYSEEYVNEDTAKVEATKLYNAIQISQPDHGEVIRIISTRNKSQLKATFKHYKQDHEKEIDEDIDSHCSGQFAKMLKIAVWCLVYPEKHFAEVIRYSIVGLGTDEETLTRAIVSRAETDMKNIKEEYKIRFRATVARDIIGDTSGYYKEILLALVGGEG